MLTEYHRKVLLQICKELEGKTLILEPSTPARAFWGEVTEAYAELESGETPEVDASDALDVLLGHYVEGW
jgi:hypothetical protein